MYTRAHAWARRHAHVESTARPPALFFRLPLRLTRW